MKSPARRLLAALRKNRNRWIWRDDAGMGQTDWSLGIKMLKARRLVQTRPVGLGGKGRPRIEVRLKMEAKK